MDEFESSNDTCREEPSPTDPSMEEVTEGIFSSSKCEPKKKEACKKEKKPKSACGRGESAAAKARKLRRSIAHYNPFIVFYLERWYKNPHRRVTEVAVEAAKIWCSMSEKDRAMYIKIARQESAKRQKMCKKAERRKKC